MLLLQKPGDITPPSILGVAWQQHPVAGQSPPALHPLITPDEVDDDELLLLVLNPPVPPLLVLERPELDDELETQIPLTHVPPGQDGPLSGG